MAVGIIPARMGSSRFPGKPLYPICGRPLVEHCYRRAALWDGWDELYVATPDSAIIDFCHDHDIPCALTDYSIDGRALDACAETVQDVRDDTVIVCVQGDEPMVTPENIMAIATVPVNVTCNVLAIPLRPGDRDDHNTVKILADIDGFIRYTTRQPVPAAKTRIGGLLAMRTRELREFSALEPTVDEMAESCDLNRFISHGRHPAVVHAISDAYQSVDCVQDIARVEAAMESDPYRGRY